MPSPPKLLTWCNALFGSYIACDLSVACACPCSTSSSSFTTEQGQAVWRDFGTMPKRVIRAGRVAAYPII